VNWDSRESDFSIFLSTALGVDITTPPTDLT
jgi:hypothetical protein